MIALALPPRHDLAAIQLAARTDDHARLVLADAYEEQGRHDVAALWRDELPEIKRVEKMT